MGITDHDIIIIAEEGQPSGSDSSCCVRRDGDVQYSVERKTEFGFAIAGHGCQDISFFWA